MNAFLEPALPRWLPTGIRQTHSLEYLVAKIEEMDWQAGVTKHIQQYNSFLIAAGASVPIDDALEVVLHKLQDVGAEIDPSAVRRQCERAYSYVKSEEVCAEGVPELENRTRIPDFSMEALEDAVRETPEITNEILRSRSSEWAENGAEYLKAVFRGTDRVAVFPDFKSRRPAIVAVEALEVNQLVGMQYFLSNPVDGLAHPNPRNGGLPSMRSQESITRFDYAVLESDHEKTHPGVNGLWLRYLCTLSLPIVSICTSGGKSIHALVRLAAADKQGWDRERNRLVGELVLHGADQAALTAVRLTRLPYGTNKKTGRTQELLYLNPEATGGVAL